MKAFARSLGCLEALLFGIIGPLQNHPERISRAMRTRRVAVLETSSLQHKEEAPGVERGHTTQANLCIVHQHAKEKHALKVDASRL